eukprot:8930319-Alexandrium_andersonii.AAC.1
MESLRYMSLGAARWLAILFNRVEAGTPWPDVLCQARAIFLAKEGEGLSPQGFRILSIGSHVYRRWGAMRLAHLEAWVRRWLPDDAHGGFKGRSAEVASWVLAARLEHNGLKGVSTSSMSIDVFKCFDQVSRQLIACIIERMGAPKRFVRGWLGVVDNMVVRNGLANAVGKPYRRHMGIPQGCPCSMMLLGALLTPMIRMVTVSSAIARSLADDLTVVTEGEEHWERLVDVGEGVHRYLCRAGSRIAFNKCFLCSTHKRTRRLMKVYRWKALGQCIPV